MFTEFFVVLGLLVFGTIVSIGYLASKAPKTTGNIAGGIISRLLK